MLDRLQINLKTKKTKNWFRPVGRPKVYLTTKIPRAMEVLEKSCDLTINAGPRPPSRRELIRNMRDKEAVLCVLSEKIDSEVMDSAPKLRVISTYSVGYDHIDVAAATRRGIYVGYTPEALTETTADLAFALILAVARRVAEADRVVRTGRWKSGWSYDFMLGHDIHSGTLGIIGMGRIGSALARRAKGFGMKVLYHNRKRLPRHREKKLSAKYCKLGELLRKSDFVSVHVSLTGDTYHLINAGRLRKMKRSAYLINTSRGPVVDEKALARALRKKWIAGAALDVYEKEPPPRNSPLLKFENVVLLPHLGSATEETRERMAEVAAMNILKVLKGGKPLYAVNQVGR